MELFVILTVALPASGGIKQITSTRVATVKGHSTRAALFSWAKSKLPAGWEQANVVFFSAEPNGIGS